MEIYLAAFFLLLMTIIAFINVCSRFVLKMDITFVSELVPQLYLWVVFIAAAAIMQDDGHVSLDLAGLLPRGAVKTVITGIRTMCYYAFLIFLLHTSAIMVKRLYLVGMYSTALQLPGWLIALPLPLCGLIGLFRFSLSLPETFRKTMKEKEEH